jgi:hypothetical protein
MAKDKVQGVGIQPTARPDLNQVEAQKVKEAHTKKVSAQDAARVASQAGFQRLGAKKKGLDIGDSSRSPIPLPEDDVDTEAWEHDSLGKAQENLTMAGAQFNEIAQGGTEEASLAASVTGSSFLPTEGGVAQLQGLADKEPPPPVELEDVTTDVKRLFNIELGEDVPVGHKVLATGLVVAGEAGSVRVEQGGINEQELASGLQKVTERGNQAVGEAQKMSKGINEKLNVQRTFVFKR